MTETPIQQPDGVAYPGITAYREAGGGLTLHLAPAVADDLQYLLDDIGPGYELGVQPGNYGVSDEVGQRLNAVRLAISNAVDLAARKPR